MLGGGILSAIMKWKAFACIVVMVAMSSCSARQRLFSRSRRLASRTGGIKYAAIAAGAIPDRVRDRIRADKPRTSSSASFAGNSGQSSSNSGLPSSAVYSGSQYGNTRANAGYYQGSMQPDTQQQYGYGYPQNGYQGTSSSQSQQQYAGGRPVPVGRSTFPYDTAGIYTGPNQNQYSSQPLPMPSSSSPYGAGRTGYHSQQPIGYPMPPQQQYYPQQQGANYGGSYSSISSPYGSPYGANPYVANPYSNRMPTMQYGGYGQQPSYTAGTGYQNAYGGGTIGSPYRNPNEMFTSYVHPQASGRSQGMSGQGMSNPYYGSSTYGQGYAGASDSSSGYYGSNSGSMSSYGQPADSPSSNSMSSLSGYGQDQGSSGSSYGYGQGQGSSGSSYGYGQDQGSSGSPYGYGQGQRSSGSSYGFGQDQGSSGSSYGNGQGQGSSGSSYGYGQGQGSSASSYGYGSNDQQAQVAGFSNGGSDSSYQRSGASSNPYANPGAMSGQAERYGGSRASSMQNSASRNQDSHYRDQTGPRPSSNSQSRARPSSSRFVSADTSSKLQSTTYARHYAGSEGDSSQSRSSSSSTFNPQQEQRSSHQSPRTVSRTTRIFQNPSDVSGSRARTRQRPQTGRVSSGDSQQNSSRFSTYSRPSVQDNQGGTFLVNSRGGYGGERQENIAPSSVPKDALSECQGEDDGLPDLWLDPGDITSDNAFTVVISKSEIQCAVQEKCLSNLHPRITRRRLLRFPTKIHNIGTAPFEPDLPPQNWTYHECHKHYHSMQEFAHFYLYNEDGTLAGEGHKVSFCLQDSGCKNPCKPKYNCTAVEGNDRGTQGISPGCYDDYKASLDCQWIDITGIPTINAVFTLKIIVNPAIDGERAVDELSYMNNAVSCTVTVPSSNSMKVKVEGCKQV